MKELTIEQKAQRYDNAIAHAKTLLKIIGNATLGNLVLRNEFERMFPELKESKESEGEKIRKHLITLFINDYGKNSNARFAGIKVKDIITWLEKKDAPTDINPSEFDLRLNKLLKQFETLPKEELASSLRFYLNVVQNDGTYKDEEKQGEQKPADKVEPKFHEGEWVVNKLGDAWHIDSFDRKNYQVSDRKGNYNYFPISKQDEMHLWTIEDAKDGDVFVASDGSIFIFKEVVGFGCKHYIALAVDGTIQANDNFAHFWESVGGVCPTTKEQRNTLMRAMTDAGWEFDFDKKELKKIEQKSATMSLDEAIEHCKEKSCGNNACALEHKQLEKWLNELKELKEQKLTEWSEEDERMLENIIKHFIRQLDSSQSTSPVFKDFSEKIDWLKALKDKVQPQNRWKESLATADLENSLCDIQDGFSDTSYEYRTLGEAIEFIRCTEPKPHWKPSDEQMDSLWDSIKHNLQLHPVLKSLYQDLKKLKG